MVTVTLCRSHQMNKSWDTFSLLCKRYRCMIVYLLALGPLESTHSPDSVLETAPRKSTAATAHFFSDRVVAGAGQQLLRNSLQRGTMRDITRFYYNKSSLAMAGGRDSNATNCVFKERQATHTNANHSQACADTRLTPIALREEVKAGGRGEDTSASSAATGEPERGSVSLPSKWLEVTCRMLCRR